MDEMDETPKKGEFVLQVGGVEESESIQFSEVILPCSPLTRPHLHYLAASCKHLRVPWKCI